MVGGLALSTEGNEANGGRERICPFPLFASVDSVPVGRLAEHFFKNQQSGPFNRYRHWPTGEPIPSAVMASPGAPAMTALQKNVRAGGPRLSPRPAGCGRTTKTESYYMKRIHQIIRSGGVATALAIAVTVCATSAQAGETKPFKETFTEFLVTSLNPGALTQPFFQEGRALHGTEVWSGVVQLFTHSNVGGGGTSVGFENAYAYPAGPTGIILYLMAYETTANGDRLVWAGTAIPQLDGSFVAHLEFVTEQCTGRFAGATGVIDSVRAVPGGGILEGTITTVGAIKDSE